MSTDPAPAANPSPASAPTKAAKAEEPEDWKPGRGKACTAVYMRGGPQFCETPGKIVQFDAKTETADVSYTNHKGKAGLLEGVPLASPGDNYTRACFTGPK
jgi:hypothetical protein